MSMENPIQNEPENKAEMKRIQDLQRHINGEMKILNSSLDKFGEDIDYDELISINAHMNNVVELCEAELNDKENKEVNFSKYPKFKEKLNKVIEAFKVIHLQLNKQLIKTVDDLKTQLNIQKDKGALKDFFDTINPDSMTLDGGQ